MGWFTRKAKKKPDAPSEASTEDPGTSPGNDSLESTPAGTPLQTPGLESRSGFLDSPGTAAFAIRESLRGSIPASPDEAEAKANDEGSAVEAVDEVSATAVEPVEAGKGLLVTIVGAKNLRDKDVKDGLGVSDPFVIGQIRRNPASKFRTHVVQNMLHPQWNFQHQLKYYAKGDALTFSIYDKDEEKKDFLGSCVLKFERYFPNGCEETLRIPRLDGGRLNASGSFPTLQVKVKVLGPPKKDVVSTQKLSARTIHPKPQKVKIEEGRGIAVTVICASNLLNREGHMGVSGLSDPFVHVEIPGRGSGSSFVTPVVWNSLNPVWNYTGQLLDYRLKDPIKFVVWDKDEGAGSRKGDMLGKAELLYEDYVNGVEGRLKLPAHGGRKPAFLSIKVEVLGPPQERLESPGRKSKPTNNRLARETKHMFLEWLKLRRGVAFRAWRMDIDRRGTSKVGYSDFMESCRHLGLSLKEARLVWRSYRPVRVATPLEFYEFEPMEWANMNHFLEVLWTELNFDLDLAWSIMDPKDKGWINFQEFSTGVQRLCFAGDVYLIFAGLDTSGQGRLWRHELDCLKLLSPESHQRPEDSPCVQAFRGWALHRYGSHGLHVLLSEFGMKFGQILTVRKFSERLARLGFTTDPLHTAMALSRCNITIGAQDIMEVLGRHDKRRLSLSYAGRKCAFKPASRRKAVTDMDTEKPEWDSTIYDPVLLNVKLGVRERRYFSRPFERPLRDQIHAMLEEKTGWTIMVEGDKGEFISKEERRKRIQGMASRQSYLLIPDDNDSLGSPRSEEITMSSPQFEAEGLSLAMPSTLRVFIFGCRGIASADSESKLITCTVGLQGKEEDDPNGFQVEREMSEPNLDNVCEVSECELGDILEFSLWDKGEEDEDICVATATLSSDRFFSEPFDGEIELNDAHEVVIEGAKLVVKVEVMDTGDMQSPSPDAYDLENDLENTAI